MKFKDGKTFSAYVRSKLHSGYITIFTATPTPPSENRMIVRRIVISTVISTDTLLI